MSAADVLFVSWCGVRLLRPRAFQVGRAAKALRAHGWRPHLVCAEFDNDSDLFDAEVESWYRPSFESIKALVDPASMRPPEAAPPTPHVGHPRLRRKLPRPALSLPWIEAAVSEIVSWARQQPSPLAISFAQPWISHLAVLRAKRVVPDLRWAGHFSDPWTDSPYFDRNDGEGFNIAKRLESEVISAADMIVFVTEDTANLVMRKYPAEWRSKVHIIPHTLDLEVPHIPPRRRSDRKQLRFVHSGSLYQGTRAPHGLFAALREMRAVTPGGDLPLHFRFVGWVPDEGMRFERDRGIGECMSWTTPLYYMPSLQEMAEADVLVVIDADFKVSPFLPSKVVDYLLFDKPMLGLTPRGSTTARFLERLGYPSASPNDDEAIKRVLASLLQEWRAGELKPTSAHIAARAAHDLRIAGASYAQLVEGLRG